MNPDNATIVFLLNSRVKLIRAYTDYTKFGTYSTENKTLPNMSLFISSCYDSISDCLPTNIPILQRKAIYGICRICLKELHKTFTVSTGGWKLRDGTNETVYCTAKREINAIRSIHPILIHCLSLVPPLEAILTNHAFTEGSMWRRGFPGPHKESPAVTCSSVFRHMPRTSLFTKDLHAASYSHRDTTD